uniref:Uncharacterized protein n=1 Tax=Cucumis sativus TaxID=3659 RepID=A0A0A0LVS0_CUCSA
MNTLPRRMHLTERKQLPQPQANSSLLSQAASGASNALPTLSQPETALIRRKEVVARVTMVVRFRVLQTSSVLSISLQMKADFTLSPSPSGEERQSGKSGQMILIPWKKERPIPLRRLGLQMKADFTLSPSPSGEERQSGKSGLAGPS